MSKYAIIFNMNTFPENPPIEEHELFKDICSLIKLSDVTNVLICNTGAGNQPTMPELLKYDFGDKTVVEGDYIEISELANVTEITYYGIGFKNMLNDTVVSINPMKKAGKICRAYNLGLGEFDKLDIRSFKPDNSHSIPGRPEIVLYTL